jgi:short-subunit dehydrogenase
VSRERIVITGASSGIGRALALALAERGADLDLLGRDPGRLGAVAADVVAAGGGASTHPFDLGDDGAVQRYASGAANRGVDALIHSAGTVQLGPVAGQGVEHLDRQLRLNLRAPYLLTQLLLPALMQARGLIVFVNSGAGRVAGPGWSTYAASKFGLRALADSLRAEVAADGVRVTSVYPGPTAGPMQERVRDQLGEPYRPEAYLTPASVAVQIVTLLDLAPSATVTDLAIRPS